MSLTVPTSRVLRPLTESLEPYDSPGTPGTTYSFQDPVPLKPNMQAESHHLAPPILDTGLLISTDDEMVDSDNDHHRDEDYDIEIDAIEVYSSNGHDQDGSMMIDDDANAYGQPDIEDDVMLDDDIIDIDDVNLQHDEHQVEYQITEGEVAAAIAESEVEPVAPAYMNSPQQSNIDASHSPAHSPQVHETAVNEPEVHKPEAQEPNMPEIAAHEPKVDNAEAQEPEHYEQQTHEPQNNLLNEGEDVSIPPPENNNEQALLETETEHDVNKQDDAVDSDHSSATLSEGQPGTTDASFAEETVQLAVDENSYEYEVTNVDSVDHDSPENYSYQHPIIISYEDSRVSLFPPPAAWTEDSSLDIPPEFFLQDTDVCDKGFDDLFAQLRSVLGESVGVEKELFLKIEFLGLNIGEDNITCKTVCLRHVLDWHNQLHQQDDSTIEPPPVCMELYTSSPRFSARLELLAAAATDGKGMNEYLQSIGFEDVESAQGETVAAEEDFESHVDDQSHNRQSIEQEKTMERHSSPSPFDEEDELLEVEGQISESEHENPTSNTNDEPTAADSQLSPSGTGVHPVTTKAVSETESNPENDEEEEELLGYDGEDEVTEKILEKSTPKDDQGVRSVADDTKRDANSAMDNKGPISLSTIGEVDPVVQSDNDKPTSIPVFGGDDGEDEGEYDNQQEYEQYDHGSRDEFADQDTHGTEDDYVETSQDDFINVQSDANEAPLYENPYHEGDNEEHYAVFEFGAELEPLDGQEAEFFAEETDQVYNVIEDVLQQPKVEGEAPKTSEIIDESYTTTDAIEISTISQPKITQEEEDELIDYEDEESASAEVPQLQHSTSDVSSTPQKRLREEDDGEESDGGIDGDQGWLWSSNKTRAHDNTSPSAPKRARAE